MRSIWNPIKKKITVSPWPKPLVAIYLMVKWKCFVHPGARIARPGKIRIGKGPSIGRCVINIWSDPRHGEAYAVEVGERTVIHENVIIATQGGYVHLGKDVSVHPFSVVYGYGGVTIGDGTRIATSTVIVSSTHGIDDPDRRVAESWSGTGIEIGEDVWVGAGARILDGIRIGHRSVIGAGAVVTRDIPDASIAVGVPARVVKKRFGGVSLGR
jgi:acetyltransferase-like isoleucine patch superfamily enzyme